MTRLQNRLCLWLLVLLALSASCSGKSTPSNTPSSASTPEPYDTGFVEQNGIILTPLPTSGGGVARIGDWAKVCTNEMSGGAKSLTGPLPVYPRMSQVSAGTDYTPGGYVREYWSNDPWGKVAWWYRHAMPPGSDRKMATCGAAMLPKNMAAPAVALFSVGTLGKDYRAVWIVGLPANETPNGWPKGKKVPRTIITLKVR